MEKHVVSIDNSNLNIKLHLNNILNPIDNANETLVLLARNFIFYLLYKKKGLNKSRIGNNWKTSKFSKFSSDLQD